MNSAVRDRVLQNAAYHKDVSIYLYNQAGVEVELDLDTGIPIDYTRTDKSPKRSIKGKSDEGQEQSESSEQEQHPFVAIAKTHSEAARQLYDVANAGSNTMTINRNDLPDHLRRRGIEVISDVTGSSPVRKGGPAYR